MDIENEFEAAEKLLAAYESGQAVPKKKAIIPTPLSANPSIGQTVSFSRAHINDVRTMTYTNPSIGENLYVNSDEYYEETGLQGVVLTIENSRNGPYVIVETYWPVRNNLPANIIKYGIFVHELKTSEDPISMELIESVRASISERVAADNEEKRKKQEEKLRQEEEKQKKERDKVKEREKIITDIAEEIHPGRWDFDAIVSGEFKPNNAQYRLTIHFPEFVITNSQQRQHTIYDLYVSLYFNQLLDHCSTLYGNRASVSYGEICSGYKHSHLHRNQESMNWDTFCLGSNTITSNSMHGLVADKWNPVNFSKMLVLLYGYVEWESLEGTPYIPMGHITSTSTRRMNTPNSANLAGHFKAFVRKYDSYPTTLEHLNGFNQFKVNRSDETFKKMVFDITSSEFHVIEGVNGQHFAVANDRDEIESRINSFETRTRSEDNTRKIRFKKNWIACTCHRRDVASQAENRIVASPVILNHIADTLENEMNNYQLKLVANELSG